MPQEEAENNAPAQTEPTQTAPEPAAPSSENNTLLGGDPTPEPNANTEQPKSDDVKQDDKPEDKKSEGAPEAYDFTAPEGVELDDQSVAAFADVAKELNLSQESAQKILEKVSPVMAQRQAAAFENVKTEWATASKGDAEFGGDKLPENLAVAKSAMDKFATPELKTLLEESGMGNHPEVIRLMYRVGKAISQDTFVAGDSVKANKGDARNLYAASGMNP